MQSSNREILLTVMTEDLKGITDVEAIAALDGVDLISLGPTDLSTALGISDPKDPRLRQTVEELVAKINRIGLDHGVGHFRPLRGCLETKSL